MGMSHALFEERILDQHTVRMVNPNLEQYKLAGPGETLALDVVVLENYQGRSAIDAYGIAEPANIATAPSAIATKQPACCGRFARARAASIKTMLHPIGPTERPPGP